jgi:CYTH domain-containing protein
MSRVRRFLIAPGLTRIIRRERPGRLLVEGHFASQAARRSYVQIDNDDCALVLASSDADGEHSEKRTPLPTEHAQALVDVCPGVLKFERSTVALGRRDAFVERLVAPAGLDVVTVHFDSADEGAAFAPPAWFGTEVTGDISYTNAQLALSGLPHVREVETSNAAVDALLDLLDGASDTAGVTGTKVAEVRAPEPLANVKRLASLPRPAPAPAAARVDDATAPAPATEGVTDLAPRRPTLPRAEDARREDGRLASVVEGLTAALAQASPLEPAVDGDGAARRGWRWSSH